MFSKLKSELRKIGNFGKPVALATLVPAITLVSNSNAFAAEMIVADGGTATITDMLNIFSQLFAWILKEGAILLSWMLDKPILMISMGLFFCGAIIAFLLRIYHGV